MREKGGKGMIVGNIDKPLLVSSGASARSQNVPPAKLGRSYRWPDIDSLPDYRKAEPPKPCSCWDDGQGYEQLEEQLEIDFESK